jgi:hypothetical protein
MVVILAGTNDKMRLKVLTDPLGCEATWSTVVALNAIEIKPMRLFDLDGRTFEAGATGQRSWRSAWYAQRSRRRWYSGGGGPPPSCNRATNSSLLVAQGSRRSSRGNCRPPQ